MNKLNLLKKYHGLRAKYYSDRKKMGRQYSFPVFYVGLAAALIIGPYLGYSHINENIIPFFSELMEDEETTVSPKATFTELAGKNVKKPKEEEASEDDIKPQRPPAAVTADTHQEEVKKEVGAAATVQTKKVNSENPAPRPIDAEKTTTAPPDTVEKAAPKPAIAPPQENNTNIMIKVATFVIETNATSLRSKLSKLGHDASIREIPIVLNTYTLSYTGLNSVQFEKIQKAFTQQKLAYTAIKKNNSTEIESKEVFIQSRFNPINNLGKSINLTGIITEGNKKNTFGHQVVIYTSKNKEIITEKMTYLESLGFKPKYETITSK